MRTPQVCARTSPATPDGRPSRARPTRFFREPRRIIAPGVPPLTTIQVDTVPAHGAVAFVDEAIHHRTPVRGHRAVRGSKVKEFIQERIGKAGYAERKKEYDSYLWWKWWTPAERYSLRPVADTSSRRSPLRVPRAALRPRSRSNHSR